MGNISPFRYQVWEAQGGRPPCPPLTGIGGGKKNRMEQMGGEALFLCPSFPLVLSLIPEVNIPGLKIWFKPGAQNAVFFLDRSACN